MRASDRESDDSHIVKRSKNSSLEAAAAAEFLSLAPAHAAAAWSSARSDAALAEAAAAAAAASAPTAPPIAAPPSKQALQPGECWLSRQPSAMLALVCRCLDARDLLSAYKSSKQLANAVAHPLTYQHGLSLRVEGMRVAMAGPSAKFSNVPAFEAALRSRLFTHFRILTLHGGHTYNRQTPGLIKLMRVLRKQLQGSSSSSGDQSAMIRSLSSGSSSSGFQLHSLTLNSDRSVMPSVWRRELESGDVAATYDDGPNSLAEDALEAAPEHPDPDLPQHQFGFQFGFGPGAAFQFGGAGAGGFQFGQPPQPLPHLPQLQPHPVGGLFGAQQPPQIFGFAAQAQPVNPFAPQPQILAPHIIGQPQAQAITIDASQDHDSDDEIEGASKPPRTALGLAAAAAGMPSSINFAAPTKPAAAAAAASSSSSSAAPTVKAPTRAPVAVASTKSSSSKRKQRDDEDEDDEVQQFGRIHPAASSDSEAAASDVELDEATMAHANAIAEEALLMIDEEDEGAATKAAKAGAGAASSSAALSSSAAAAAASSADPSAASLQSDQHVNKRLRKDATDDSASSSSAAAAVGSASASSSSAAAAAPAAPRDLFDLAALPCTRFLKVLCLSAPAYALADLMFHLPSSLEVLQITQVLSPYALPASLGPAATLPRDFLGCLLRRPLPKLKSMLVLGSGLSSYANPEATRRPPVWITDQQCTTLADLRTLHALTTAPQLASLESVSWMVLLPLSGLMSQWASARAAGEADPQPIAKVRSLLCKSFAAMGTGRPAGHAAAAALPQGLNGGSVLSLFPNLSALSFTSYDGFEWASKGKDGKPTHVPSPWPTQITNQLTELCITGRGDPVDEDSPPAEQGLIDCLAGVSSGRWSALQRLVLVGSLTRYRQHATVQLESMLACMPVLAHLCIPNLRLAGDNLLCFRAAKQLTHLRGLVWPYRQSDAPSVTALHGAEDTRMQVCFPSLISISVAQALEPTRFPARALLLAIPTLTSVGWRNEAVCHPNKIEELWLASRVAADKAKSVRDAAEAARAASALYHTARTSHIARLLDKGLELKDAEANWDAAQALITRIGSCAPEDEDRIRSQHYSVALQKLMEERSKRAAVKAGASNQNEIDDQISRGVYTVRATGRGRGAGQSDDDDSDSDDDTDEQRAQRVWRHSVTTNHAGVPSSQLAAPLLPPPQLFGPVWAALATAEFCVGDRRGLDRHADLLEEGAAARMRISAGAKMDDDADAPVDSAAASSASSSSSSSAAAAASSTPSSSPAFVAAAASFSSSSVGALRGTQPSGWHRARN